MMIKFHRQEHKSFTFSKGTHIRENNDKLKSLDHCNTGFNSKQSIGLFDLPYLVLSCVGFQLIKTAILTIMPQIFEDPYIADG